MNNNGTVLFYNLGGEKGRKIRMICMKLGLGIRTVEPEEFGEKIGYAAKLPGYETTGAGAADNVPFTDEMLVFKGFSRSMLDTFLAELRKGGCTVSLKAVVTDANRDWDSYTLHAAVAAEHVIMHRQDNQ